MGAKGSMSVRPPKQEVVTLEERCWRELEEKSENEFHAFLQSLDEDIIISDYDDPQQDETESVGFSNRKPCCYC